MMGFGLFDEDVFVMEIGDYKVYRNCWTESLTKKARDMDINGIELRGWRVLYLIPKDEDDAPTYVLYDSNGKPRIEANGAMEMKLKINMHKFCMKEDNDIVTMAERLKEEKR